MATGVVAFAVHPVAAPAAHAPHPVSAATVVIPARYASTRLPGKPLADLGGRPMIEHVYRRAARAATVDRVIVATDDARIADVVTAFGGDARMTRRDHATGSDRLAEIARGLTCEVIVNVQGDEPLIAPPLIDAVVARLDADPTLHIATVRCPIRDPRELANPHVVKVVVDARGDALYFSRAPIPYRRGTAPGQAPLGDRHIGLYAYRRACLLELATRAPTRLEQLEQLEQLRALEAGFRIATVPSDTNPIGVDTPDDLERVRRLLATGATE